MGRILVATLTSDIRRGRAVTKSFSSFSSSKSLPSPLPPLLLTANYHLNYNLFFCFLFCAKKKEE